MSYTDQSKVKSCLAKPVSSDGEVTINLKILKNLDTDRWINIFGIHVIYTIKIQYEVATSYNTEFR